MLQESPVLYKVNVNEFEFSFTQEQIDDINLLQKTDTEYNILTNHKSVNAIMLETGHSAKTQNIEIEGEKFNIQIKDQLDLMLDEMGFSAVASKQIKEIKAPMPGLVLDISVSEGQQVHEGDKILTLVAMKMENSIIIHTQTTIKRIAVTAGEAVEKGQLLVELE